MASPRRQRPFAQVDVFTSVPYLGNALAVVKDATGLTPVQMQQFARWTNLSETTFLLPPTNPDEADYKVKIYTPDCELPFAGHPTLGSAHAWLEAGGKPRDPQGKVIVQECGVGLVKIRREEEGRLALAAPKLMRTGPVDEKTLQRACHVMGISRDDIVDHEWLDNGPGWFGLLLKDAQKVLDVKLENLDQSEGMNWGLVGLHASADKQSGGTEDDPLVEIRAFAPSMNIPEDPVTGSFNAGVAQWLIRKGVVPKNYVASQGTCIHRRGRIHISTTQADSADAAGAEEQVWVAGNAVTCISGSVLL